LNVNPSLENSVKMSSTATTDATVTATTDATVTAATASAPTPASTSAPTATIGVVANTIIVTATGYVAVKSLNLSTSPKTLTQQQTFQPITQVISGSYTGETLISLRCWQGQSLVTPDLKVLAGTADKDSILQPTPVKDLTPNHFVALATIDENLVISQTILKDVIKAILANDVATVEKAGLLDWTLENISIVMQNVIPRLQQGLKLDPRVGRLLYLAMRQTGQPVLTREGQVVQLSQDDVPNRFRKIRGFNRTYTCVRVESVTSIPTSTATPVYSVVTADAWYNADGFLFAS